MSRVKRGVAASKRRKNVLKRTKGYLNGRRTKFATAKTAMFKAGAYSYRDRKVKKRTNRQLWIIRLNAAAHQYDLSYSKLISKLKKNKIEIDRKALSQLALICPEAFKAIVDKLKA